MRLLLSFLLNAPLIFSKSHTKISRVEKDKGRGIEAKSCSDMALVLAAGWAQPLT